jgi:ABC-type Fe2+-enterobactin transport system substrate-binding protein
VSNEVHALIRHVDGEHVAARPHKFTSKRITLTSILLAHAPDVGSKMSSGHKLSDDRLMETWRMAVEKVTRIGERLKARPRHDHVPKPQAGKECLVQRADVDDVPGIIEPLER